MRFGRMRGDIFKNYFLSDDIPYSRNIFKRIFTIIEWIFSDFGVTESPVLKFLG